MASLSDDMRDKRHIKRRFSVLIIDKDLGNYGLYKSILSAEYDIDCINSISMSASMCSSKTYEVILVDGQFNVDEVKIFYGEVVNQHKKDKPILIVLEEKSNKESIIEYLAVGAREYIEKPFTKESLTNILFEQLLKRREYNIRKSILIVDEDYEHAKELKSYLKESYNVFIVNTYDLARQFMESKLPDLVICEIKIFEKCIDDACRCAKEKFGENDTDTDTGVQSGGNQIIPVLVTMDNTDGETISKCAKFNPQGFLMKPIEKNMLLKTLERIFLVESYTSQVR